MYGSFLSLAHRETVLVDTWRTRATSAVRRYSAPRVAPRCSAIRTPFLRRQVPAGRRGPVRLNTRPSHPCREWRDRIKLGGPNYVVPREIRLCRRGRLRVRRGRGYSEVISTSMAKRI